MSSASYEATRESPRLRLIRAFVLLCRYSHAQDGDPALSAQRGAVNAMSFVTELRLKRRR
jgi:hypothetical protein